METAYFRYATKPGADPEQVFNLAQTAVLIHQLTFSVIVYYFCPPVGRGLDIPGKSLILFCLQLLCLSMQRGHSVC